jgi:hypothetical protein
MTAGRGMAVKKCHKRRIYAELNRQNCSASLFFVSFFFPLSSSFFSFYFFSNLVTGLSTLLTMDDGQLDDHYLLVALDLLNLWNRSLPSLSIHSFIRSSFISVILPLCI